jgi:hypothetical protein
MKAVGAIAGAILISSLVSAGDYFDETKSLSVFAFDDVSIPFTQNLRREMRNPERHPGNPVVKRGEPGSVDAMGVQFYGSILRENGKFRLWYVAFDDDAGNKVASTRWRPAYAESEDGVHWTKPELGLVAFAGDWKNNLIRMEPGPFGVVNLKVLADPDDPDPARRYKISTHVYFRHQTRLGTLAPFASSDGLTWKSLTDAEPVRGEMKKEDLVIPGFHFEPCGGLYQWEGLFYICGQNALPGVQTYQGRIVRMYRSRDFVNWSPTSSIGFVRANQHDWLGPGRSREGEQNHEGISVWNRGNVLLGITGRWHGAEDWKDVSVDLGFVMCNDGVNFREPRQEWTFLKRGEDGEWDQGGLLQGQGFENIGEETFVYYGAWDPRGTGGPPSPRGGIGIAKLPRDRFADLRVDESNTGPGDYQLPETMSEFVTATISLPDSGKLDLYLNADGLGPEAALRVEVLDRFETPIPGYSGERAAILRESGFQVPVRWSAQEGSETLPDQVKLRMVFEGKEKQSIRFSALYIRP